MCKRFLGVIGLAVLFSASALAADGGKRGAFEVGPYGGYGFLDDYRTLHPKDSWLVGGRVAYWFDPVISFEPSYQWLITPWNADDAEIRSLRFNLLYHFLPEKPFRPFLTVGLGWEHTKVKAVFTSDDLGVNSGLGFHWFLTDQWALRVDGRYIYTEIDKLASDREHNIEVTGGVAFFFGGGPPKDADGDGVPDKKDQCPNTPLGAKVDEKGCPIDSDGDGVADGIDQCPNTPAGAKVDEKGCPVDSDGDGVADGIDQCADTPLGAKVDEKGCPIDSDKDGVADGIDQCADTPEGTKVDEKGCPVNVDTDGDGVLDDADKCPNTPAGTKVDEMGCPVVTKSRGVLKGVVFKFGKAELTNNSKTVLDSVAKDLTEFPNVKVEVQGHTDNVGSEAANAAISQARAEAVAGYLASGGIDKERLVAKGYGSSAPVVPNKTSAGRAKNRRVELKWLDQ